MEHVSILSHPQARRASSRRGGPADLDCVLGKLYAPSEEQVGGAQCQHDQVKQRSAWNRRHPEENVQHHKHHGN